MIQKHPKKFNLKLKNHFKIIQKHGWAAMLNGA